MAALVPCFAVFPQSDGGSTRLGNGWLMTLPSVWVMMECPDLFPLGDKHVLVGSLYKVSFNFYAVFSFFVLGRGDAFRGLGPS